MKKLITILFLIPLFALSQVRDTVYTGEYMIRTLGSNDYIQKADRNLIVGSPTGILIADTVFYVPSTAPDDTIYTIMAAANNYGNAAILQERGSIRDTTIVVSQDSLIFGSYGSGAKPKLFGSELITGWTLHSGNIWKATFATTINQLFLNGVRITAARYPNDTWITVTSVSQSAVISSNIAVQAANYYQGANVLIQLREFRMNTRSVTASSESGGTTTLTLSSNMDYESLTTDRFYLTNKLEFLDEAGEWYYDDATNTVYLWKPDGTEPTDTEVRGSTLDYGIVINDKDYVTVKNLEINHYNEAAIDAFYTTNSNLTIDNNTINGADRYGIYIRGTENVISNNTIDGVNVGPIYANSDGIIVNDNTITNTGVVSNISPRGWYGQKNVALYAAGQAATIRGNIIDTASYVGIEWEGQNTVIDKNFMRNTGQLMKDGGAIYTYQLVAGSEEVIGSQVTNNIIDGHTGLSSIYMDNNTEGVTITGNTAANAVGGSAYGIFYNIGNIDNVSRYNTLFNTEGIRGGNNSSSGLIYEYNTIVNSADAFYNFQAPLLASGIAANIATMVTTWDNNTYVDRHHTSDKLFQDPSVAKYTFANWKIATGIDASSTLTQTALNANETEEIFYNSTKLAQTYYLNNASNVLNDVTGASVTTSFALQPFTSVILRGLDLNYISTTQYETVAPIVTSFTIEETSGGLVDILSFTVSGNPTKYLLTESATTPSRSAAWTDTIPAIYFTSTEGGLTLYAWCMDAVGNISTSVSDNTTISALATIGTTTIGGLTTTTANTMRANSFTMTEDGYLVSMVVYHNSSTAAVTLGVYSDNSASPNALLGSTASTEINDDTGWQEIQLSEPVFAASGSVIWLAYNKSGTNGNFYVATGTGLPRAYKTQTYGTPSLTNIFIDPTLDTGGNYSVYVKYVK